MTPLFSIIHDIISNEGPITLERYMEIVLHHPDYGYYRHNDPLGAHGDFVTAPEVTQMFGEMLGVWCIEMWKQMGEPTSFALLELGPGRGTLLMDILRATARVSGFQKALRLHILESNATLRKIQQEKLADYAPTYVENLEKLPWMPTIVLANEFFDTIPMRQFTKTEQGWRERMVDCQAGRLLFIEGEPQPSPLGGAANMDDDKKMGWIYEVSPWSLAIVKQVSAHIVRHGGAGLIIDYGYSVPMGADTLDAWRKHKFIDPLEHPGEADVTADVDFSALKTIALHTRAKVAGPIGQGEFLRNLGIEVRAAQLMRSAAADIVDVIKADLNRLVDPAHMGVAFKAMAIMAPSLNEVPGFM